jgi:hypothetical protein
MIFYNDIFYIFFNHSFLFFSFLSSFIKLLLRRILLQMDPQSTYDFHFLSNFSNFKKYLERRKFSYELFIKITNPSFYNLSIKPKT